MNIRKPALVFFFAAAVLPFSAQAHRPWLLPSSTVVEGKEPWITVDAAVSENLFDFDTRSLKLDDLVVVGPDGARVSPENAFTGRLRSSFDVKLAKQGTYKASIVTQSIMASYKLNGEAKRWRGTEAGLAKEIPAGAEDLHTTRLYDRLETFISLGKPNGTVLQASGIGLELVPVGHPNELTAGGKTRFRFLLDGKPAANLAFSIIPGGVRYRGALNEQRLTADAEGYFSLQLAEPGMYLINASFPPAGGASAPQPERRVSYSATVEVLPE